MIQLLQSFLYADLSQQLQHLWSSTYMCRLSVFSVYW